MDQEIITHQVRYLSHVCCWHRQFKVTFISAELENSVEKAGCALSEVMHDAARCFYLPT